MHENDLEGKLHHVSERKKPLNGTKTQRYANFNNQIDELLCFVDCLLINDGNKLREISLK